MAGPAPKPKSQRVNRNEKLRGELTKIFPPSGKPPSLPARGKGRGQWSARTRRAWEAWWSDPASTMWGPGDVDLVEHLADVYEEWVRVPKAAFAAEARQLRDLLGLTPKGKQDRRWVVAPPAEVHDFEEAKAGRSAADRMKELRERAAAGG